MQDNFQEYLRHFPDYEFKQLIGVGSYGDVYHCIRKKDNQDVALKIIRKNAESEFGVSVAVLREIVCMSQLCVSHLVKILDTIIPTDNMEYPIGIVMEYLEGDLRGAIKLMLRDDMDWFTSEEMKYVFYQLFLFLVEFHKAGYLHRDLKPSNILIGKDMQIRIADFGLSKRRKEYYKQYTSRVASLWYRPPELLLGFNQYGPEVDIWSAGCIMAELCIGIALFPTYNDNDMEQLDLIYRRCGYPSDPITLDRMKQNGIEIRNVYKRQIREYILNGSKNNKPKPYGSVDSDLMDLIDRILQVDPSSRPSAEEILKDKYFDSIRDRVYHASFAIDYPFHDYDVKRMVLNGIPPGKMRSRKDKADKADKADNVNDVISKTKKKREREKQQSKMINDTVLKRKEEAEANAIVSTEHVERKEKKVKVIEKQNERERRLQKRRDAYRKKKEAEREKRMEIQQRKKDAMEKKKALSTPGKKAASDEEKKGETQVIKEVGLFMEEKKAASLEAEALAIEKSNESGQTNRPMDTEDIFIANEMMGESTVKHYKLEEDVLSSTSEKNVEMAEPNQQFASEEQLKGKEESMKEQQKHSEENTEVEGIMEEGGELQPNKSFPMGDTEASRVQSEEMKEMLTENLTNLAVLAIKPKENTEREILSTTETECPSMESKEGCLEASDEEIESKRIPMEGAEEGEVSKTSTNKSMEIEEDCRMDNRLSANNEDEKEALSVSSEKGLERIKEEGEKELRKKKSIAVVLEEKKQLLIRKREENTIRFQKMREDAKKEEKQLEKKNEPEGSESNQAKDQRKEIYHDHDAKSTHQPPRSQFDLHESDRRSQHSPPHYSSNTYLKTHSKLRSKLHSDSHGGSDFSRDDNHPRYKKSYESHDSTGRKHYDASNRNEREDWKWKHSGYSNSSRYKRNKRFVDMPKEDYGYKKKKVNPSYKNEPNSGYRVISYNQYGNHSIRSKD